MVDPRSKVTSDTGYDRYFLVATDTDPQPGDAELDFTVSIIGLDVAAVGPVDVPGAARPRRPRS